MIKQIQIVLLGYDCVDANMDDNRLHFFQVGQSGYRVKLACIRCQRFCLCLFRQTLDGQTTEVRYIQLKRNGS